MLLPQVEKALSRLELAIRDHELIGIFGDFDVDGVTATAILVEGLTALGGRAIPYLPDRFAEGYGVNNAALSRLKAQGVSLVVTADCGISNAAEVDFAHEIGLDVIVVDHHSIPERLPDAVALVDPKLPGCEYPCQELAACGVAFKLLGALGEHLGRPYQSEMHLDLVALGTVCDLAPMQGENRSFVRKGLRALAKTRRPGLWALAEFGRFDLEKADAEMLGFRIGPRLNAAGRIAHAGLAYELITTHDEGRARELALKLEHLNVERQRITREAVALSEALLAQEPKGAPLVMVGHAEIHQGIVGLVAGRLAEAHRRPAFVYQYVDGYCKGSARSIPEFNVVAALQSAQHLLSRFGGHRQAGGFTVPRENMPALREFLTANAQEQLAGRDLQPILEFDEEVELHELGPRELQWLPYLQPHGIGNPEPVFVARGLTVSESRPVGGDRTHLRLRLRSGTTAWPGIAFGLAHAAPRTGEKVDVAFVLRTDNRGRPDLHVRDLAPV
jgi:single-stranded-DNA-specific exonuclease